MTQTRAMMATHDATIHRMPKLPSCHPYGIMTTSCLQPRLLYSSGAKAWKNVGNVSTRPTPTSTAVHVKMVLGLGFLPRSPMPRTTHATTNAATAMMVLPESGPTDVDHSSQDLTLSFAPARVVRIPRTRAPNPAARNIAATGPNGLSMPVPGPDTCCMELLSSMVSIL